MPKVHHPSLRATPFKGVALVVFAFFPMAALWADVGAASADGDERGATADDPVYQLQDYVVTGTKVLRDTQTTYDSLGLLTQESLETFGAFDFRDSLRLLTNVQSITANGGNSGFSIRGINSEGVGDPGAQLRPLSTLVVDGATQSFEGIRRGARGAWDVERIEVYRGPQSTRQGRNALAGAILIETNSPTSWWEGALRGAVGSEDRREGAFMLSGPVVGEQLMFRLAGERIERELDIDYAAPELEAFAREDYEMLRGKLLYVPEWAPGLELEASMSQVSDNPAVPAVDGNEPFDRRFGFGTTIFAEIRENEIRSQVLEGRYALGEQTQLTSVSAFTETESFFVTPQDFYERDESRRDRDFTQEIRLNHGEILPGEWSGFLGLFYGRLKNDRDSVVRVSPGPTPFLVQDLESASDTENWAVFGEITIPLGERLSLTAGARYDEEEFEIEFIDRQPTPSQVRQAEGEFDAFLPRLTLIYALTAEQSLSLIYARGYRGGFAQFDGPVVDPEYLSDYEIAYRSEWLEGRLRINANLFFYDWTDQQITIDNPNPGLDPISVNAGQSEAYGAELEVDWAAGPAWTLGASLGYLKTEFVDFQNFDGNEFPGAPRYSGSLRARYDFFEFWHLAGDFGYVDESFATGNVNNSTVVKGHGVANLAIGYEREHWRASLAVRNLFDRDYVVGKDRFGGVYVGDPRAISLSATLRF